MASRPRRVRWFGAGTVFDGSRGDPHESDTVEEAAARTFLGTTQAACVLTFFIVSCVAGAIARDPAPSPPSAAPTARSAPAAGPRAVPGSGASASEPVAGADGSGSAAPERIRVELVGVVDGDTIKVVLDGQTQKIRYLGIDTPESVHGVEFLGKEASVRNAALLAGQRIRVEFDGPRRDRFGRVLAYVWAGDVCVCRRLLEEGLAEVYRKAPNIRRFDEFLAVEATAKRAGCGVWDLEGKLAWDHAHPAKLKR